MKKQKKTFKAILLGLGCLAFLPQMQGVSPPPDGCYPEFHDSRRMQGAAEPYLWRREYRNWLVFALRQ